MTTYCFLDVAAAISGPGGTINLASGAGAAEEGISIEPVDDVSSMVIGAGGEGMHNLSASTASTITLRYLKTSPVNAQLQTMYNAQTRTSITHGKNTITVRDIARGDNITLQQVAFKKRPPIAYGKEGGIVEWTFDAIKTSQLLGRGE